MFFKEIKMKSPMSSHLGSPARSGRILVRTCILSALDSLPGNSARSRGKGGGIRHDKRLVLKCADLGKGAIS
jgi:hypothetical protein